MCSVPKVHPARGRIEKGRRAEYSPASLRYVPCYSQHTDDGTRIAYETHGNGDLKIVLLHGSGGSATYWRAFVSHLNLEGLQVLAPSYRGHGHSDKPATGYALDRFAQDVLAVSDAAGAQRFVLVGFSMSGKFAQYIATTHSERVVGLALIAPVPAASFRFRPRWRRRGAIRRMIGTLPSTRSLPRLQRFRSSKN